MSKLQKPLYLQHDVNELQDLKIQKLLKTYSYKGYAIFWLICPYLLQSDDGTIRFSDLEIISEYSLHCPIDDVKEVVDGCIEIGLFHKTEDELAFYNKRVQTQREEIETAHDNNVENGRKGGKKSAAQRAASPPQAPLDPGSSPPQANKKDKEINNHNDKEQQPYNNIVSCGEQTSLPPAGGSSDELKHTPTREETAAVVAMIAAEEGHLEVFMLFYTLSNEICDTFKVERYDCYDRIGTLLDTVTTDKTSLSLRRGAEIIRQGLAKLKQSPSFKTGNTLITIDTFFNPDCFKRLIDGKYDAILK